VLAQLIRDLMQPVSFSETTTFSPAAFSSASARSDSRNVGFNSSNTGWPAAIVRSVSRKKLPPVQAA
jgi:hypothetical protein